MVVLIISSENIIYPIDFAQLTDLIFEEYFFRWPRMWALKEDK